jgi:iron(II)-dependent oxidoreductase
MKGLLLYLNILLIAFKGLFAQDSLFVLIPSGEYLITQYEYDSEIRDNKKVPRKVYINEFLIQKYEVTNEQYEKFIKDTNHGVPKYWDNPRFNNPRQPVVGITFEDAQNYAKWSGFRLPSEIEWEIAARGGLTNKKSPNGDSLTSQDAKYFTDEENTLTYLEVSSPDFVGKHFPNGYYLYDMAGNVAEFTSEEFHVLGIKPNSDRSQFAQSFLEFICEIPLIGRLVQEEVQYSNIKGGSW